MSGDDDNETGDNETGDNETGHNETGDNTELDEDDLADQYPPGPSDHRGNGGMATRENAPDVAEGSGPAAEPTG